MQPNRPFQATPRRGQTTFNVPSHHHSSSTAVTPRNGAPSSRSNVTVVLPPSNAAQAHQQQMNNAKQTYETLHRVKELVKDVDNTFTELLDQHETQEYSKIEIAQVLADRDRIREECGLAPASTTSTTEANERGLLDGVVRNGGGGAGLAIGSLTSHQVQQKPHPIVTVDAAQSAAAAASRRGVGAPPAIVTSDSPAEVVRSTSSTPTTSTAAGPRAAKPPMDLFQVDEGATRRALRFRRVVSLPTTTSSQNTVLSQSGLKESDKNTSGKGGGKDSRPTISDTVSQYHAQLDRLVRDGDEAQQRTGDLMMYVASVEELLTKLTDMQEQHTATQAAAAGKHPQRSLLAFSAASGGASLSSFTESHFKQIKDVVQRMCDTARSVTDAVGSTVDQLVNMKEQLEARDVAVGPVQSMLKMTKEELLFARQQRDEAKRELMLHRVCARWRRLVRQGREMRGEEFGLICTATQLLGTTTTSSSIGQVQQQQQQPPPPLVGTPSGSTNMESDGAAAAAATANAMFLAGAAGNVSNPHSAVAGLTPALRLQGAAMARNAFRTVPPRKGASAGDVERAETELTHCIANVDVMFATTVHVAIGDYDVLWNRFPYAMKAAVRLFNQVVDHVAARFIDGSALVYRSRGSVAFAPHGGYHLLLFRHPHEAIHFSTMLHVALLLAPWPQKILDIRGGPSGDRSNDATDEDFSLGATSSPSVEAGAWGETMKLSDGTNHRSNNAPTTNSSNAQQQQASTPSQPIRYDATALDTSGVTWNGHTNPPTMLATNASGAAGGDDKQRPTASSDQLRFDERVGFVQAKQNATTDGPTPLTICGGAGTIIYDPERCVHTIELQRPRVSRPLSLGGNAGRTGGINGTPQLEESLLATSAGSMDSKPHGHRSPSSTTRIRVQPKSRIDILIKEIEEFQLQRQLLSNNSSGGGGAATAISFAPEYQDALAIAEKLSSHVAIGPARVHALLDEPVLFRGLRAKIGIHTGVVFVEGSVRDSQPPTAEEDLSPDDVAYSFRPAFGRSSVQTGSTRNRRGSAITAQQDAPTGADADRVETDAFFGTANAKVPLVYGAAVMKAAILCGTASGGETVISQQSYRVVSGAVDSWGLFARPVAYPCSSTLFSTTVPVVNDLRYTLFEPEESCFQVLPLRLAQRAMFFPEEGAAGLYNPTWWLPFNTSSAGGGGLGDRGAQMAIIERQLASPALLFGERTSTAQAELLFKRIHQLEQQLCDYKNFAVTAASNARRGRQLRETYEQAEMEKHDAPAILHLINTLCHLSDVTTTDTTSSVANSNDAALMTPQQSSLVPRNSAGADGDSPRQRSPSTSPTSLGMVATSVSATGGRIPSPAAEFRNNPVEGLTKLFSTLITSSSKGTTLLAATDTPADAPLRYREVMSPSSPAHGILQLLSTDALTHDDHTIQAVRSASDWVGSVLQPQYGTTTVLLPSVLLQNPAQRRGTTTRGIGFSPPSPRDLPPLGGEAAAHQGHAAATATKRSHLAECVATFVVFSLGHTAGSALRQLSQDVMNDNNNDGGGGGQQDIGNEETMKRIVHCLDQQIDALWRNFDGFASNGPSYSHSAFNAFGASPMLSSPWALSSKSSSQNNTVSSSRATGGGAPTTTPTTTTTFGSGTPLRLHLHVAGMTAIRLVCSFALAHADALRVGGGKPISAPTVTSWNLFVKQSLWSMGGQFKRPSSTSSTSVVVEVLHESLPISPSVWLSTRETLVIRDLSEVVELLLSAVYNRNTASSSPTAALSDALNSPDRLRLSPRPSTAGFGAGIQEAARSPRRAISPTSSIRNADGGDIPSLVDDKLLEGEARMVAASVASDMRCWAHAHPQAHWERVMECVQLSSTTATTATAGGKNAAANGEHLSSPTTTNSTHHSATNSNTGGAVAPKQIPTYIGITFFCEEPEFPFGQIRDPQQSTDDTLHAAPLVRRAARTVVEQVRALYAAARESCEYFLPSLGFVEGDMRPRSGATPTGASTVPTVTLLFPEVHHEDAQTQELGYSFHDSTKGKQQHHGKHAAPTAASSTQQARHHGVISAHTMSVDEILIRASMRPLSQRGPPQALGVWSTHHVESWSLSLALALASLHRLRGACGFVTPWTVFVPRHTNNNQLHQHHHPRAVPHTSAAQPELGGSAYLLEGSNFMLWKMMSASRHAGQDALASSASMQTSSALGSSSHNNIVPAPSSQSANSALHPQVVEWLPPELLSWAAGLSEDGENTTQYITSMIASITSGAPSGTIQRGPFEEGIDAKAVDVWMLGMFIWYIATGGVSPFTAVKGYVPPHVSSRNARRASAAAGNTGGGAVSEPPPAPPITKRRCEDMLNLMHKEDGDHSGLATRTSPIAPPSTAPTAPGFLSSSISLTVPAALNGLTTSGRQGSFASIASSFQMAGADAPHQQLQRLVSRMEPRSVTNISPPYGAALAEPQLMAVGGRNHRKSLLRTNALHHGIGTSNMFGSIGCLVRNLRICLESKTARRLAPYRAALLFATGTEHSLLSASGFGSSAVLDDLAHSESGTEEKHAADALSATLHSTSFVLLCDLLHGMLQLNPAHRLNVHEVMRHPYFAQVPTRVASDGKLNVGLPEFVGVEIKRETNNNAAHQRSPPNASSPTASYRAQQAATREGGDGVSEAPGSSGGGVTTAAALAAKGVYQNAMSGVAPPKISVGRISNDDDDQLLLAAASPTNAARTEEELNATTVVYEPSSAFVEFVSQDGPLFQVLPASFSLGVPLLPSMHAGSAGASSGTGQLDAMLDGNTVEWNTAQITLTTGHAAPTLPSDAVMGALMELKHRRGTALVPVEHDAVVKARQHAACATARRHGLTDDGTHKDIGFPIASELGPSILRLLGLPQVTKASIK